MTKKADHVGTLLAAIAAIAVIAAVIAGYLAVGGPGQARAKRLDAERLLDVTHVATIAQCVFAASGKAPHSVEELRTARIGSATGFDRCDQARQLSPPDYGAIAYRALADDQIEICATFATAMTTQDSVAYRYPVLGLGDFPELTEQHPAGRRCYVIQLHKQNNLPPPASDVQ